jgi:hypothetical protein
MTIGKFKEYCINMKKWLVDLFKDERGVPSIKPVIAFIGVLFLCLSLSISLFSKRDLEPSKSLVDAIVIVICVGMGADSLDKFSFKKTIPSQNPPEEQLPS